MRYVRFCDQENVQTGILFGEDQLVPVKEIVSELNGADMITVMNYVVNHPEFVSLAEKTGPEAKRLSLQDVRILSPIERPIHDVICVGVNYMEHVKETQKGLDKNFQRPQKAIYFSKRAIRIIGPEETIEACLSLDPSLDYEAELAVIIGKGGKGIKPEEVPDHIFGYSVFNDLSSRNLQHDHVQWYLGKSLDTYTAMGPCIVSADEIQYPPCLAISSTVNGELRQNSNTEYFIHGISEMVAEISEGMTLECGDIIATGTPSGVGMGFTPGKFMKDGDVVTCEIEKIGVLRNYVKALS